MLKRSCVVILLTAIASATTLPIAVVAQSGGNFAVTKSVIAGGGGRSASGNFTVDGTIGESIAGVASTGGAFDLAGGFWGVGEGATKPTPTPRAHNIVINEIDYDQVGTDNAEFVELINVSAGPVNLDNYTLELVNGGAAVRPFTTRSTCQTSILRLAAIM